MSDACRKVARGARILQITPFDGPCNGSRFVWHLNFLPGAALYARSISKHCISSFLVSNPKGDLAEDIWIKNGPSQTEKKLQDHLGSKVLYTARNIVQKNSTHETKKKKKKKKGSSSSSSSTSCI